MGVICAAGRTLATGRPAPAVSIFHAVPPTALALPVLILADTHVGVGPATLERDLLTLLTDAHGARTVVINGDLFEFWFQWRHVMPQRGYRVMAKLAELRDRGIAILWIAGNHDCWGGAPSADAHGIEYLVSGWRGRIGDADVVIEHGDGLREREDAPYRRLRRVLRARWAMWCFRWLHPDLGSALALASSHTSRNTRPKDGGAGLRAVAESRLTAPDAPALVVFGHSHVAALEPLGRGVYANTGSWLERARYLWLDGTQVVLRELGEGGWRDVQALPLAGTAR